MTPWLPCPVIDLDWGKPVEERFEHIPREVFQKGRRLLEAVTREIPPGARLLADAVRLRTAGRFHQEARALARYVGGDWRSLMLANIIYDLALATLGCSTVVLPTPAGPVLARNMDWRPEALLAQTSYLIRAATGAGLVFASAGWPGSIGVVSGLSGQGFAIVLNAVIGPEGVHPAGYPILLHIRRVLEDAADFASAVQMLTTQRLAAPCLLTVVGTESDQRVVIERSPTRHAHRWGQSGRPLLVTNDYRLLFQTEPSAHEPLDETSCTRYEALSSLFADRSAEQEVEDDDLLHALSDPAVIQDITAQHVIIRPKSQQIRLFVPRRLVEGDGTGMG